MGFTSERYTSAPRRNWHTVEVLEIQGEGTLGLGRLSVLVDGRREDWSRFSIRQAGGGIWLAVGYMAMRYVAWDDVFPGEGS